MAQKAQGTKTYAGRINNCNNTIFFEQLDLFCNVSNKENYRSKLFHWKILPNIKEEIIPILQFLSIK